MGQWDRWPGVVRVFAAMLSLGLILLSGATIASAQGTDNAAQLSGRLGGTLTDMRARFGEPSWTDTGLIGYNSVALQEVPTILVIYYDNQEEVNKISLVYTAKPTQFIDQAAIAAVAGQVMPQDATCGTSALTTSAFGSEVYGCKSAALGAIHPDWTTSDALGSLSYAVDPTADEYYEIIVQPGTGVSTASTTTGGSAAAPTAVQSATSGNPAPLSVDEMAYANAVVEQTQIMSSSLQRFSDLMSSSQAFTDSWIISVAAELVTWQTVYQEALQMPVPPRFAAVHAKYLEGLSYYNQAVDQITYGIDNQDANALEYAATLMNMGTQAIGEAKDELDALGLS